MKSHKAILKFVYCVIGLSAVVLVALTIYQQQQIRKMNGGGSTPASANKPSAEVRESAGAMKPTSKNAGAEKAPAPESDGEAVYTQRMKALGNSYAVLFRQLSLSIQKQEAFKSVLVELQIQTTPLSMELLDTSLPEEKQKEIRQHLQTLKDEGNDKVREILGADNFEKYLTYEERLNERTIVTAFLKTLDPDKTLADTKEQAFIDAMFEEREKVEAASPEDNEVSPPAGLDTQISRIMKTTDQTYSGYLQVAATYLSPTQVGQFKDFLDQRRNRMEMSLDTMRQLFEQKPAVEKSRKDPDDTTD